MQRRLFQCIHQDRDGSGSFSALPEDDEIPARLGIGDGHEGDAGMGGGFEVIRQQGDSGFGGHHGKHMGDAVRDGEKARFESGRAAEGDDPAVAPRHLVFIHADEVVPVEFFDGDL